MKLKKVKDLLGAEEIYVEENALDNIEVITSCGADLMSDVLAFSKEKTLLLTGLTNPQVIRTAEMIELTAVVFVRGKQPPQETIELAREKGIFLLSTDKLLYEACGILYKAGLDPEREV
jgi:predicted type IV restriction endonuclease